MLRIAHRLAPVGEAQSGRRYRALGPRRTPVTAVARTRFWSGVTECVAAELTASSRPVVGFDTALVLGVVALSVVEYIELVRLPLASRHERA
ncbi:MAG: hypothetical protein OEW91_14970, partial [Acidimicrobiia bacterium]|nr:hypothetical protein [Acidimicrobiia bacterium]